MGGGVHALMKILAISSENMYFLNCRCRSFALYRTKITTLVDTRVHLPACHRFLFLETMPFKCDFCEFVCVKPRKLILHTFSKHKKQNTVLYCAEERCLFKTGKWMCMKKHLSRVHLVANIDQYFRQLSAARVHVVNDHGENASSEPLNSMEVDSTCTEPNERDKNMHSAYECSPAMHNFLAKHLLELETSNRIPKSAVDKVATLTIDFASSLLKTVQEDLQANIANEGVNFSESVAGVFEAVDPKNWVQLDSDKRRKKFFAEKYSYIEPKEVYLGSTYIPCLNGGKPVLEKRYAATVPMKRLLECLLGNPAVLAAYRSGSAKVHDDQVKRDISDGSYVRNHPFTKMGRNWLQIILSHDDIDMENPLRSRQKNKMAMFYFTLANFPVESRSRLQNIFTIAIGHSKDVKQFGLDFFLQDFISVVNALRKGLKLKVGSETELVFGDLVMVVADTPAAALLGGFKESVGWADSPCRRCRISKKELNTHFVESNLELRDMQSHLEYCDVLEDSALTRDVKTYWSKRCGLKKRSVLCSIADFPVTQNIVQDPMHVLLEGCFAEVLARFLKCMEDLGNLTLEQVNRRLREFQYSYLDKGSKPMTIPARDVSENIFVKQKAACMLTMAYVLPIILGDYLEAENPYYRHLLGIIQIVLTAFSPFADDTTPAELSRLVYSVYKHFGRLYPNVPRKPKMHYLLHLSEQMMLFGPLRSQNTFRFEGKHGFFKSIGWRNFKNLPMSMLEKQQLLLCSKLTLAHGNPNPEFLRRDDFVKTKGGQLCDVSDLPDSLVAMFPTVRTLFKIDLITVDGLTYRAGVALVVSRSNMGTPRFLAIRDIYSEGGRYAFVGRVFKTGQFRCEYNSYEVHHKDDLRTVALHELTNRWPLPIFTTNDSVLVTDRFACKINGY